VTLLFTDVEGSTRLLQQFGDGYAAVLAEHHRLLREVWARYGGVEVDTAGDAFFVAFDRASDAVAAAAAGQLALEGGTVRVRMGLHTGEPSAEVEGYVGLDVHRAARIAAAGHGGQVLLSQATADLASVEVRDLGLHRLKDLTSAERLFQLGTESFPPLKTLHETNLPVPATPFLGREGELDALAALLHRPEVRLVTLTGPGGSGKTRLALQAAGAAADVYEHGVWWVPLASLDDHSLVETVAAQALGAKDTIAAAIGDKRLLLLLDNFEHLLDAAAVVGELMGVCPRLTVLVTSREPLHIDGEWEVAVDPLRERDAVELFVQRAMAVSADFAASGEVAEICRRLDYLPLAIELAAARVKALSPAVLLERLEQRLPLLAGGSRSAPERQRTLRATIAWSYELLMPVEQALFGRLAVFVGGCTLEAAEEVCDAEVGAISSLVDKSLLRRTGDRYWMLETIREFAAERLDEAADAVSLRDRHSVWCTVLAERAAPELHAANARQWLDRLEEEQANLRAAIEHLVASNQGAAALRLVAAIWHYWAVRGHWTEGRRLLSASLAVGGDDNPSYVVEALWGSAVLAIWQGEPGEGERFAMRMLELVRPIGLTRGEAIGLHVLAIAAHDRGELEKALPLYEESLRLTRTVDDAWFLSVTTNNLGTLYSARGDYARAAALFEESLAIGETLGDLERRARELNNLGAVKYKLGDKVAALELYRRAVVTAVQVGAIITQVQAFSGIAACQAEAGNVVAAARLIGRRDAVASSVGLVDDDAGEERDRTLAVITAVLGRDRLAVETAKGAAMSTIEAVELALGEHEPDSMA
jgi:predicted ATPase